ncbi:MAG: hypothetical protein WBP85_14110, partial [Terracidiphilus sp.]
MSVAYSVVRAVLLFLRGLFHGLLGRLLCGCLLGCFLGCHLPILPFRWVASILQLEIAVEECIESRFIDVKKKTLQEWKNRQQFFAAHFGSMRASRFFETRMRARRSV